MERLLTIGEFAQRCGLSRSALRFYDQNDLLRPRSVDEETGYRYYAAGQLELAALVRRLRAAEMPVGVVRSYLAADMSARRRLLDAHLAAVQRRAACVQEVVEGLRDDLATVDADRTARFCALPASDLARALAQVSFAIADASLRAELGAVWVEADQESLRLIATDSYRMAVRDLVPESIGTGALRGVIEAAHVDTLSVAPQTDRTVRLSQGDDGAIELVDGAMMTTVGHAGESFPNCERILSGLASGHQIAVPREAVTQAVAELAQGGPQLRLGFEPGRLVLHAGQSRRIAGDWSGPPMEIFIDAGFFADAVNATVGPDLVIEASDPRQPIVLRSADTGTFSVLTMPIGPPDAE